MYWMLMPLKRYADFRGRSRRKEYWMFALGLLIFYAIVIGLVFVAGDLAEDTSQGASPFGMFGGGLLAIVAGLGILAIIVPSIAVQVRRFHDQDKSGWFVLLTFIPYVGGLIVLVFMCLPGTRGDNRYGPDPIETNVADVFG